MVGHQAWQGCFSLLPMSRKLLSRRKEQSVSIDDDRGAHCAADLQVTIVTAHGLRDSAARRRRDDWGPRGPPQKYPTLTPKVTKK